MYKGILWQLYLMATAQSKLSQ